MAGARFKVVCLVATTTLAAGCGGGARTPQDRSATVREFLADVARHDGAAACRQMSSAAQFGLTSGNGRVAAGARPSCEQAIERIGRGPDHARWQAMARGRIDVADAAGLDQASFDVTYRFHGQALRTVGGIQSDLSGSDVISMMPRPG